MLGAVSLLMLVFVILVSWKKNINAGILGLVAAFVLGFFVTNDSGASISGVAGACKELIAAFPSSLFLNILFPSMLFVILNQNGTLKVMTDKMIGLAKGNQKLFPVVIFVVSTVLSCFGVNGFAVCVIMVPIAVSVAHNCKLPVNIFMAAVFCGLCAGQMSPVHTTRIVCYGLAETYGFEMLGGELLRWLILEIIIFAIYYVVFKAYKFPSKSASGDESKENTKMNRSQIISLVALVAFVVLVIKGFTISIVAATLSCLLILFTDADEKKVMAACPWSTLILVCGMSMFIKMVNMAGGIETLSNFFESFMSPVTAAPLYIVLSALMGFCSSGIGVVMPTMYATAPGVAATFGIEAGKLGLACSIGTLSGGVSPFSTTGSLMMGLASPEDNENNKLFNCLLLMVVVNIVTACTFALLGGLG